MKRLCALILSFVLVASLFAGIPVQAASIVAKGIDVSAWQGNINWNAVKADSHGSYAILRAYCAGKDTYFDTNYANAKAAGVPIGAYCFIYGTTTAAVQAEVNAFLQVIQGKQFEYPIYIDIEDDNYYPYSKDYNANLVKMACQMLEDAGFYAGVYTYLSFTQSYVNMNLLTEYTTWIAHYASSCGYTGAYDMWQYGCEGSVGGISPVDVNYCYTDLPSKVKAAGKNGYGAEQQKFDEKDLVSYDNNGWSQQWHITTGKADTEYDVAQEFRPTDTVLKGVQLFMKVGTSARIQIAIGTSQDNKNVFAREFQIVGNQHEGWYSMDFQQDVAVTKGYLYYLFVRVVDSDGYAVIYTNKNSVSSSCPIRAYIRTDGGTWGKTEKCIGFNMLTEFGMVRYPFPVDGNTMMIYDGDSIDTASTAYSTKVSLDRYYRREGTAGLKMDCTNPVSSSSTVGGFTYIRMARSVDLTKYNYLSYQLYLSQDMTSKSRFQVNYTTTGEDGYNSIVNITGWKAGWHTVTIEKSSIGKAVASADWSKIANIRFIWFNDDRVATPIYFYLDNLHASVNQPSLCPYEADDATLVIHDGEQDRAFFSGYTTLASATTSQTAQGSKSILMDCLSPTGQANNVGGMVFLSLDNAVDLTSYDAFSFDLYVSRVFSGNHQLELTFSSDDVNLGYSMRIPLNGLSKGWHTLTGKLSECTLRSGQTDRWDSINTVRITWYNLPQDTDATSFCVDYFRVTRSSEAAAAVVSMIAALPDVLTVNHWDAIQTARAAYNALTDNQKELVSNLDVLEAAERKVSALQQQENNDKAAAQGVDSMIAALPGVNALTLNDKTAVNAAREAYQDLTLTQRNYVNNLNILEAAEAQIVLLEEQLANQFIPGDVNEDGVVDNKDYSLLQRYLNDWAVTLREEAADVNCDGKINNKDYSLLQRYLNDWDVTLGNGQGQSHPITQVRVGTYNIHILQDVGNDPAVIAKDIIDNGLEIVGLQEVDNNTGRNGCYLHQAKALAQELGWYYGYSKAISLGNGEYGTAVISKYPIESYTTIQLESGSEEQRVMGHGVINAGGTKINFLNTHLSYTGQQSTQIAQIAEYVKNLDSFILTGDFNTQNFTALGILGGNLVNNATNTFITNEDDGAIDNIVVKEFTPGKGVMVDNNHSDHNLLYTDIIF